MPQHQAPDRCPTDWHQSPGPVRTQSLHPWEATSEPKPWWRSLRSAIPVKTGAKFSPVSHQSSAEKSEGRNVPSLKCGCNFESVQIKATTTCLIDISTTNNMQGWKSVTGYHAKKKCRHVGLNRYDSLYTRFMQPCSAAPLEAQNLFKAIILLYICIIFIMLCYVI